MAGQRDAASSCEEGKPITQPLEDLLDGKRPSSPRGELDRQRKSVEPPAQTHNGRSIFSGQLKRA